MTAHAGRRAVLCLDTYAGRREHPCRVVGETRTRFRIEADQPTPLPGSRVLQPGSTTLVPRYAIRVEA